MNMKTILAAALTAGFFVQPCMTALASVSAPESDKNQIGPGFEAPAEENAESAFTPWTKVDGVYVDDTGKAIDGAVLRGVSVSKWQGDVDWGKAAADDISFALVRMASIGYEGEYTMDEYFDQNGSLATSLAKGKKSKDGRDERKALFKGTANLPECNRITEKSSG